MVKLRYKGDSSYIMNGWEYDAIITCKKPFIYVMLCNGTTFMYFNLKHLMSYWELVKEVKTL